MSRIKEKASKPNQSIEKFFSIIELMADHSEPCRLQDIANMSNLPASTALRLLNTITRNGYAVQDPDTLKYSLTLKFTKIGEQIKSQNSLRNLAHPYLIRLSRECKESSCLGIEDSYNLLYIDTVEVSDSILKTTHRIGKNAPLHSTGIGKLLLMGYPDNKLDDFVDKIGLKALTPKTIVTKQRLKQELKKIKTQGFAVDNEECEMGVRCLAVPIYDYTGSIIAGVSISGPATRMSFNYIESVTPVIIEIGKAISSIFAFDT